MTRTARSAFPRAMIKDRSESRSGLDKSLRKNGNGGHNWGNITDDYAALEDEELEQVEDSDDKDETESTQSVDSDEIKKPAVARAPSDEDIESARKFRKNVFKGEIDLSAIARTSSAVSPTITKSFALPIESNTTV
ncbi:hypothetical protein C8J56DRAFT_928187 [Mycena floridula]|nr:hypothetical protein C8J56DRAFT_928187 [Mycena floridula]